MNILIPMAGAGSRLAKNGYNLPKPLIKVLNKSLIEYSIDSFNVEGRFIFITRAYEDATHNAALTDILTERRPEHIEIRLDALTNGATETALMAEDFINNDEPLIIYNCDQLIRWDPSKFLKFIDEHKPDAALVLYNSRDPKNSFAEIDNGVITNVVEKNAVSDHALIGFHYWARGRDFVASAKRLQETFLLNGRPECYVSETFNYLPAGSKILPYHVSNNTYVSLGTPADISRFVGKTTEFENQRSKTLFIDIDGTILKHQHSINLVYKDEAEILPGVVEKINQWDTLGHRIILVTARKESTRAITEQQLHKFGIAWDQLVMGVGGGERFLINDKLELNDPDRAMAINVQTDAGFNSIGWEDYNL